MPTVHLAPGDDNALRVTNAINKNADFAELNASIARDYRYITEAVGVSEDYGSIV